MNKEIVKELIQDDLSIINLIYELNFILNKKNREKIFENYQLLRKKLGGEGASRKAAEIIVGKSAENDLD